jgi:hypothetical protein
MTAYGSCRLGAATLAALRENRPWLQDFGERSRG